MVITCSCGYVCGTNTAFYRHVRAEEQNGEHLRMSSSEQGGSKIAQPRQTTRQEAHAWERTRQEAHAWERTQATTPLQPTQKVATHTQPKQKVPTPRDYQGSIPRDSSVGSLPTPLGSRDPTKSSPRSTKLDYKRPVQKSTASLSTQEPFKTASSSSTQAFIEQDPKLSSCSEVILKEISMPASKSQASAKRAEQVSQCNEELKQLLDLEAVVSQAKLDTESILMQQSSQNKMHENEVAALKRDLELKDRLLAESNKNLMLVKLKSRDEIRASEKGYELEEARSLHKQELNEMQARSRYQEVVTQLQTANADLKNMKDVALKAQAEVAFHKTALEQVEALKIQNDSLRHQVETQEKQLLFAKSQAGSFWKEIEKVQEQLMFAESQIAAASPRNPSAEVSAAELQELQQRVEDARAHAEDQKRVADWQESKSVAAVNCAVAAEAKVSLLEQQVISLLNAAETSFTQEPTTAEFQQQQQQIKDAEAHAQEQKRLADAATYMAVSVVYPSFTQRFQELEQQLAEKSFTQQPTVAEFQQLQKRVIVEELHAQEQKRFAEATERKHAAAEAEVVKLKQRNTELSVAGAVTKDTYATALARRVQELENHIQGLKKQTQRQKWNPF